MLWLPHDGDIKVITNDSTVASLTPGTSVTTGATAATKGTVVELISAANNVRDSWGIMVRATNYSAAATAAEGAMDILIGGATDDILIPNLLFGHAGDAGIGGAKQWFFPLHIPAGVRVAVQAAGARTSTAFFVMVQLYGGSSPPWRVGRKVITYGMGTVPNGTTVTPATVGVALTTTQITASTTEDHFAFLPSFQSQADTTLLAKNLLIGIAVGASTEDNLSPQWVYSMDANENMAGPWWAFPAFRDVPSGTRLTIKAGASNTLETQYGGVIHAVS